MGARPGQVMPACSKPMRSVLWTLECIHSLGTNLGSLTKEQRSLVNYHERSGPLLVTLRVGRLFQEDFFNLAVRDEEARSAVSREHFQIWADEVPRDNWRGASDFGGIPCSFFLTNYSVNGTVVNGKHLRMKGEQA